MLNLIWGIMIIISIISAIITGRMDKLTDAVFNGSKDAITLCISMLGMMCFWSGIMNISDKSGISKGLSNLLYPILRILFPDLKKGSKALDAICLNISANILGLGNAATPLGIAAMKELDKNNNRRSIASNSMVTFVILNTSSLQLIPTMMSILRKEHGSVNPFDILPCIWVTSLITLLIGVILSKVLGNKYYE